MKILCAWCLKEGKPGHMGECEPLDDPSETHAICPEHRKQVEAELEILRRNHTDWLETLRKESEAHLDTLRRKTSQDLDTLRKRQEEDLEDLRKKVDP